LSDDFVVDGNSAGSGNVVLNMPVDNSDAYFSQGAYDFLFIVFDAVDRDFRLTESSATDNSLLRNVLIEPSDTDNKIYLYDSWFEDEVDIDGDGYHSEAWFVFDVDEENGSGEDVYVDISYRPFETTDAFSVNGVDSDPIPIEVNQYQSFSHGSYDFKIDLKFDSYNIIEDWTDA
jgi:hypothetical protein